MRAMKHRALYHTFIGVLGRFLGVVAPECSEALEGVRETTTQELAKMPSDQDDHHWGLIHGDLWAGKSVLACQIC